MIPETPKNILLIDDDLTVRKLLTFHLQKKEYKVLEATNADDGYKLLKSSPVDLVLCDVGMEGMDGFSFCKMVRQDENYRVLPFIFVTAKNSIEDKQEALDVGGDDIVTKPFDVLELMMKVQALIRRADIYKAYGAKKSLEQSSGPEAAKIMLVDDDNSLARLFQYNLTKAGFECKTASNAADGMKLGKSYQPDIIISDIMMPNIDGFEFRKMVMEDPELKNIPFLFLTSKGGEEDILDGYELGVADYILKTAGPRVVVAKVSAIIKSLGKERQKVVSELHRAADTLRVKVVPDTFPSFSHYQIKHWHSPYKGVPGGDFIDYFNLNDDTIAIILGDVMGKKWGAWYFAIAYAGYVRSAIRVVLENSTTYTPHEILDKVNRSVYQDAKISEVFATLSVILINNKTNILQYSGAGDLPLIYKNPSTGETKLITSKGMLLGFTAEGFFEDTVVKMNPGDIIALFSDGIIESRNPQGVALGTDSLAQLVDSVPHFLDPLEFLKIKLTEFTANKFEDDISLITIKANN